MNNDTKQTGQTEPGQRGRRNLQLKTNYKD